jgi:NADH dehydrogenase
MVTPELSIPGHDEIYVVGDLAHVEQDGELVPGVAQGAMQGAKVAVHNIFATIDGRERSAFRYRDLGSMATIGRAAAVAQLGGIQLSGYVAWLAWAVLHILLLITFKNRVIVSIQWLWSYFTHERASRLIHGMVHTEATVPPVLPSKRGAELPR